MIILCQDVYISKILKRYSIENCYPVDTPIAARATEFIVPFNGQATVKDIKLYRLKIGSLMYLAIQTRPDIIYKVSTLLCLLLNPSPQHMRAID